MSKKETISRLEDHTGYWLRFVSNHVSQAFTRKIESQGVTVAEWVLLREMFDAGATNPSQLADRLGMTRGAVSKLIERSHAKKLVARSSSGTDRRYQTVALTTAGKKLVPVLAKLADENDREFFGHWTSKQEAWLVDQLKELVCQHGWKETPVR